MAKDSESEIIHWFASRDKTDLLFFKVDGVPPRGVGPCVSIVRP